MLNGRRSGAEAQISGSDIVRSTQPAVPRTGVREGRALAKHGAMRKRKTDRRAKIPGSDG